LLGLTAIALGLGLCAIAAMTYTTWPENAVGVYLHERRNREANIRALESRIARETEPAGKAFYQAWLAEEKGDLAEAIRGFQSLRDRAQPGTQWHLKSSLRLGLAYGRDHQPEQELAMYQALMDRYPGQSRLSQATYYLRRGEKEQARRLLDDALARDERDGSLGADRQFALGLRAGLGPGKHETPSGAP
jgi:predicted Zn-dependent protease